LSASQPGYLNKEVIVNVNDGERNKLIIALQKINPEGI
jgi:hypothetical protein